MSVDVLPPATGALPSVDDYRDAYVSAAMPKPVVFLPEEFDTNLNVLGPVMDQAKTPSCVSHSVALEMKHFWYKKTGKVIDFSPRFLDTLVKRFDGLADFRSSAGTYPRMVFKLAVKYGCATTKTVTNKTYLKTLYYRDDSILTNEAFDEAQQYQLPGYIRIKDDLVSTRRAISQYGSVSQLLRIGEEWWTPSWLPRDIEPLRTPKVVVSGHQINTKGWNDLTSAGKPLNKLRNSWGYEWASKGEAFFNAQEWQTNIFETWAVAEIPKDVKTFLATLPTAEEFNFQFRRSMRLGDFSEDVKWAQIAFMILGLLEAVPPEELGYFGRKTMKANLSFQRISGISPSYSEHIGPKTMHALNKQFEI